VLLFDKIEVFYERFFRRRGKHRVPVFIPLAGANEAAEAPQATAQVLFIDS
jgi:hypothetical protein